MGLAASQARLLFITSRQTNLSANMQRISNQKMILARDNEDVAANYSRMMSATKLKVADGIDLSYNAIMGADAAMSGNYKLLTNANSKALILSSNYAQSLGLGSYGSAQDFKKSACGNFDTFAEKMTAVLSGKPIETPTEPDTPSAEPWTPEKETAYNSMITAGATFINTNGTYPKEELLNVSSLLNKMGTLGGSEFLNWQSKWKNDISDGSSVKTSQFSEQSYSDFAKFGNDTVIMIANDEINSRRDHKGVPYEQAQKNIASITNAIVKDICTSLDINNNTILKTKLQEQVDKFLEEINPQIEALHDKNKKTKLENAKKGAKTDATNGLIGNGTDTTGTDNDFYYLNVSELARRLANIAISVLSGNGIETSSKISDTNNKVSSQTDRYYTLSYNDKGLISTEEYKKKISNYYKGLSDDIKNNFSESNFEKYALKKETPPERDNYLNPPEETTPETSEIDYSSNPYYNFIKSMYEQMSNYGWAVDSNLTNSLTDKLYNGTYLLNNVSHQNDKNMFEQVADEETRAKAESYYDSEMAKINRKEKMLDMDMNKLQTEYDALTTDIQSVQAIIQKNVDRSFTFFQA